MIETNSEKIHLFILTFKLEGLVKLINSHLFCNKKLFAFQILFKKFLYPLTLSSDSFTSLPGEAIESKVNLRASALYFSIRSKGSITFPFDFDIFCPFSSRTSA